MCLLGTYSVPSFTCNQLSYHVMDLCGTKAGEFGLLNQFMAQFSITDHAMLERSSDWMHNPYRR